MINKRNQVNEKIHLGMLSVNNINLIINKITDYMGRPGYWLESLPIPLGD